MEVEELAKAMQVVELSATTRASAIHELVDATKWADENVRPEDVLETIEEREATAQTIVDAGLALPHAVIEWPGHFRLVLGRSQTGVKYEAEDNRVYLIVLLVVGQAAARNHLEILAAVAKLLNDVEFRHTLVKAPHIRDIKRMLVKRAGQETRIHQHVSPEIPLKSIAVVQHAVGLATSLSAQAILLALDDGQLEPWEPLKSWPGRLFLITSKNGDKGTLDRTDTYSFDIPHASLSRMDRASLGLLLAAANGLVDHEREVVCVAGARDQPFDSISVTKPAVHFRDVFPRVKNKARANIPPEVILRVLSLAIELASEGREAHPVGATFVIGDTRQVTRHTQQLVLNAFHGFARRLRNILDPSLTETVKEFALLDGAFIVEADGTILSAGTYLIPMSCVTKLAGGLGARHQAAAAITRETRAVAVTVSQSTGTVTLFQNGGVVLTLERAALTRW